jgi:transposase-like protein
MTEDFKDAIEVWKEQNSEKTGEQVGDMINQLWSQLGSIDVKCPNCSKVMSVQTLKKKKCYSCGRTFDIYPKNSVSRIMSSSVPPNKIAILHNIHSLETTGQFVSI